MLVAAICFVPLYIFVQTKMEKNMEDFNFDISSGLISPEEAEQLFEKQNPPQEPQQEPEEEVETKPTEEEIIPSEKVGQEEKPEENAITPTGDGSSPLASIANALKIDGIFPELSDEELSAVKTPEDFAELVEKAIQSRLDERQKRIDTALGNGVPPSEIQKYEQTLSYLDSITEDALNDEGEQGENLRKQLIFNDLITRGYSRDRAVREVEKSFRSNSDLEDAKDALASLNSFYRSGYEKIQQEAKDKAEDAKKARQKDEATFRKMVLEDDIVLGETKLDKRTRQRVFDAVTKPVYKDPDTGALLTQVQKYQKEHPLEFFKQIGLWFVLTESGKDFSGLAKQQAIAEKNKGIRELERKINSSALNPDGSLRYMSGEQVNNDTLLQDGWEVDLNG